MRVRDLRFVLVLFIALPGCAAFMPPPPQEIPIPPPSGKDRLDPGDVKQGLDAIIESLADCVARYHDTRKAMGRLLIAPSGEVLSVEVEGLLNLTQSRCFARDLRLARFPSFIGPPQTVTVELARANHRYWPDNTVRRRMLEH